MKLETFYNGIEIHRNDKLIHVRFLKPHLVLSTCRAAGGLRNDLQYVLNHQGCEPTGHLRLHKVRNPLRQRELVCAPRGLPPQACAMMGTAANMHHAAIRCESFRELEVVALVTGGVETNAGRAGDPGWSSIVLLFRLPRVLTALTAGAGLALSGLMMQTLFRNPLAGPSVLGISSGASLGVALVVMGCGAGRFSSRLSENLGTFGNLGLVLAAIAGAGLVLIVIMLTARFVSNITSLLIVGLLGGYALNSIVSVLIHFSRLELIQAYLAWSFGNFGNVTWREMGFFLPLATLFSSGCLLLGKHLNGLKPTPAAWGSTI